METGAKRGCLPLFSACVLRVRFTSAEVYQCVNMRKKRRKCHARGNALRLTRARRSAKVRQEAREDREGTDTIGMVEGGNKQLVLNIVQFDEPQELGE